MTQSGTAEWDIVWERYLKESDPQEKVRLLKSLASIQVPWVLRR